MAAGCAVRPSRPSKLRRAGNHPGSARPIETRRKYGTPKCANAVLGYGPVSLAAHPEKSPLRGKTSVSSFESRTLKATRVAKICFPSAQGRFGGGNFALDLDRLHRRAVCKTWTSTTGAKARATTIVDHELATSSLLLPSPASGQQSCCFFFKGIRRRAASSETSARERRKDLQAASNREVAS